MRVEIKDENIERRYSLPWDLFKFKIWIKSEEQATYFKEWITNINLKLLKYYQNNNNE